MSWVESRVLCFQLIAWIILRPGDRHPSRHFTRDLILWSVNESSLQRTAYNAISLCPPVFLSLYHDGNVQGVLACLGYDSRVALGWKGRNGSVWNSRQSTRKVVWVSWRHFLLVMVRCLGWMFLSLLGGQVILIYPFAEWSCKILATKASVLM